MNDAELVHLLLSGPVATITLDSPANRNALSRRLVAELTDHLATVAADDAVRVVVLTHTGGTFCAGADLAEAIADGMERGTRSLLALLRAVAATPKPVVAVVRGHVRAGGMGLVGACDVALVSDDATFAFTEALLGLAPAIISLTTRRLLRDRDAAWLYLSGVTFAGHAAADYGLATASRPADELDDELNARLAQLASASPQGLRETKALLNAPILAAIDASGDGLVATSARLFASAEAREGMAAFRERRTPSWRAVSD